MRALDAFVFAAGVLGDELDRDIKQEGAAHQLQIRIGHCLGDNERENDAQQHGNAGSQDHAPQPLLWRQRQTSHRDDDSVVAGQDDIHEDDLQDCDPERRVRDVLPQKVHCRSPLC